MINWTVRYAALFELDPALSDPGRRVLEVGSATEGIARYLQRTVVGVDRVFSGPVNRHLEPVRASVLALPFASGAFEDVVCVDTLEDLDGGERARALRELIRVARSRVIISGPAGAFAEWGDAAYAEHIARRRRAAPDWLQERARHGIPSLADLLEMLVACGHPFTIQVNEGAIQHYSGLFADNYPFMSRFLRLHEQKFSLESPLRRAEGDAPYSYLFTIDVAKTRLAVGGEPQASAAPSDSPPARAMRTEIFAVGHRLDWMPDIPGIRRILAGARGPELAAGSDIMRDDSGDSIAHRNPDFSEMTAIYWVWKNRPGLDGVGFCHYRRYFDFRQGARGLARETRLRTAQELVDHRGHLADVAVVARTLDEGAIVVTRTTDEGIANAEQYMSAHVPEHYLAMVNYLLAHHPHLARQVVAHVGDTGFYGNNMFLMRWADFDRLCRFWFDCLFALDRQLADRPAGYQRRVLAFLSERLFDIHVRWLRDSGRRVIEYPLFFLEAEALSGGA